MADGSYEIKIQTGGDPSGADKVADALKNVGNAAAAVEAPQERAAAQDKKVAAAANEAADALKKGAKGKKDDGEAARELSDDLATLGQRNNATKDVVEGLDAALRGNAQSVFGVAKAVNNLIEIFTVSTPAGRALQLALIGINSAALLAQSGILDMGEAAAKGGAEAEKAAKDVDLLTKAMETAGKAKSEAMTAELTAIKDQAKAAADELQRIVDLRERLAKATNEAKTAELDADPTLSASEREVRRQQLQEAATREARQRADQKRGEELAAAEQTAAQAAEARAKAQAERDGFAGSIDGTQARFADLGGRRRQLDAERAELQRQPGGTSEEAFARGDRLIAIAKELAAIDAQLAGAGEASKFVAEQRERLKRADEDLAKATAAAAEAEAELARQRRSVVGIAPDGAAIPEPGEAQIRSREDRRARAADAKALREAIAADEAAGRAVAPGARSRLDLLTNPPGGERGAIVDTVDRSPRGARVIDATSLRNEAGDGAQTGAQLAATMAEVIRERDAALLDAFKVGLSEMDQKYKELRDQVRSSRR